MSHHNVRYVTLTCGNSATRLNDMKVMEQQNTPTRIRTFLRTAGAVVAVGSLGVFGAACGDDEEKDTTPATEAPDVTEAPTDTTTEGTDAPAAEILIEGAWARNSPMMAEMGAAYMTITSPVDDKLCAASADASIVWSPTVRFAVGVYVIDVAVRVEFTATPSIFSSVAPAQ